VRFAFIEAEKASYPVSLMCRTLNVSRSGFYAWRTRPESPRSQRDQVLAKEVRRAHQESNETYGSPRVTKELASQGTQVSRKRVARLMREQGLCATIPRAFRRTTDSSHDLPVAENLLKRDFSADAPDRVWAADITYVRTWQGWLYLAVVIDLFSRRVVGWAVEDHMQTDLVMQALHMAFGRRLLGPGLIHHSDRGSQYASEAYRAALKARGALPSMSRRGDCWDNAVVESFFGTLKTELLHRRPWPTHQEAKAAIAQYIELFYNPERRHSTLGYLSPAAFERVQLPMVTEAA
jgi:transposase InsO family protein